MARPTKPKDVKPKALEPVPETSAKGGGGAPGMNMIVMALIIVLCTTLSTAASMYFLAPMIIKPLIGQGAAHGGEGEGEGEGEHLPSVGPILELDEFTVNLKDTDGVQRYLRAKISLTVTAEDPNFDKLHGEALHKWEEAFHIEMGHYVPAVRDVCISALTRRTAAELSTLQGKQELKEEIKRNVDGLFHGKRRVIRVNLENFIIQ